MKIYIITAHDSVRKRDVAYTTSRRKLDEYFSLTTGGTASLEKEFSDKQWWYEETTKENIFKRHRENVHYKGNDNLYWYSFRIEEGL